MRVLWFANSACAGESILNKNASSSGGGWLTALNRAIEDDVELHIAFYYPHEKENFKHGRTYYYPIKRGNFYYSIFKNIFRQEVIDCDDSEIYLNLIREIKPDLIHIHGTENPFGCIIDKTNVPTVISIQGNITACLNKYCSGIEKKYLRTANTLSIRSMLSGLYPFRRGYSSFVKMAKIEQHNMLSCKHIIGRTDWDRRITRILAPKSKYHYGGEVLRDVFYQQQWMPHNREKLIIQTTNGNSFYKGFETICQAVSLLNGIGLNFEWRVAGIGQGDLMVKIVKRAIGESYPTSNLKLLGRLTDVELADSLMDADMYVMSSHIENSPNNLCEAMLLGMPCVATFAGGTGSMLTDHQEGLLIQDGDPWAMAGAVLEINDNQDKAVAYGQKARGIATSRHNKNNIIESLLLTYNNILTL